MFASTQPQSTSPCYYQHKQGLNAFAQKARQARFTCLHGMQNTYYPEAAEVAAGADVGAVTFTASCMSVGIMDPAQHVCM